jgi:hypothetical protein
MILTAKTNARLIEIQKKVKSKVTGQLEFKNRDEVIDLAVEQLYNHLKKQRAL